MKVSNTQQNTAFGNRIVTFPRVTSCACEKAKTLLVARGVIALENLGPAFLHNGGRDVLVLDKSIQEPSTQTVIENYAQLRARLRELPKKSEEYKTIRRALGDVLMRIVDSSKTTIFTIKELQ